MIVDDDPDDIDFFREALSEIDTSLRCVTATDGEEALRKLRETMKVLPNYLFLDLNMSRMDGKSCLRELKKDPHLKNIPVIILSTSSHHKDEQESFALGATYFMTKPSTFDRMKAGIQEALRLIVSGNE